MSRIGLQTKGQDSVPGRPAAGHHYLSNRVYLYCHLTATQGRNCASGGNYTVRASEAHFKDDEVSYQANLAALLSGISTTWPALSRSHEMLHRTQLTGEARAQAKKNAKDEAKRPTYRGEGSRAIMMGG